MKSVKMQPIDVFYTHAAFRLSTVKRSAYHKRFTITEPISGVMIKNNMLYVPINGEIITLTSDSLHITSDLVIDGARVINRLIPRCSRGNDKNIMLTAEGRPQVVTLENANLKINHVYEIAGNKMAYVGKRLTHHYSRGFRTTHVFTPVAKMDFLRDIISGKEPMPEKISQFLIVADSESELELHIMGDVIDDAFQVFNALPLSFENSYIAPQGTTIRKRKEKFTISLHHWAKVSTVTAAILSRMTKNFDHIHGELSYFLDKQGIKKILVSNGSNSFSFYSDEPEIESGQYEVSFPYLLITEPDGTTTISNSHFVFKHYKYAIK